MRRAQALRQLRKPASLTTSCSQKRFCAESKRCPSFYKLLCVIEAPFNNLQLSNIFYVRLQLRPSWCITILPRAASSSLSRTFPISKHPVHCACTAFDLQPTVVREAAPVSYLVRGVGPSQLRHVREITITLHSLGPWLCWAPTCEPPRHELSPGQRSRAWLAPASLRSSTFCCRC